MASLTQVNYRPDEKAARVIEELMKKEDRSAAYIVSELVNEAIELRARKNERGAVDG